MGLQADGQRCIVHLPALPDRALGGSVHDAPCRCCYAARGHALDGVERLAIVATRWPSTPVAPSALDQGGISPLAQSAVWQIVSSILDEDAHSTACRSQRATE